MFGWLKGWSFLGKRGRDTEFEIGSNDEPPRKEAKQEVSFGLIDNLPNELLVEIASYLNTPKDVVSFGRVNQRLCRLLINQNEEGAPFRFNFSTPIGSQKLSLEEAREIFDKAQQEELKLVEKGLTLTDDETNKLNEIKGISEASLRLNKTEEWLNEVNANRIMPEIERSMKGGGKELILVSKRLTRFPLAYLFRNEEHKRYLLDLTRLHLNHNQLSGPIPTELGQLGKLHWLHLKNNQFSGPIPSELGQLGKLHSLSLNNNQLSGPIPSELGQLRNLKSLYLNGNQFSGSIPPELGQLGELEWLRLNNNQLSGPISSELGGLRNLACLRLNGNQLSGPIPKELGQLGKLHWLHLENNQFSGPIPPELGQLGALWRLHLNDNQLSGPIPEALLWEFGAEAFANQSPVSDRVEVDNTERPQAGNRPRM